MEYGEKHDMKSRALTMMFEDRKAIRTGRRPVVSTICPAINTANSPKKAAIHPFRPLILVVFPSTTSLSMHLADKLQNARICRAACRSLATRQVSHLQPKPSCEMGASFG